MEDTDRWGQELGTYSVYGSEVGYVEEQFWNDIKLFERYSATPEGSAEQQSAKEQLSSGAMVQDVEMPIMKRLLDRSKTLLWQFNMRVGEQVETEDEVFESSYIRTYATFDQPTFREYTPAHDEEVKKLQTKCDEMNNAQSES